VKDNEVLATAAIGRVVHGDVFRVRFNDPLRTSWRIRTKQKKRGGGGGGKGEVGGGKKKNPLNHDYAGPGDS